MALAPPGFCTFVSTGARGPELLLARADGGTCPDAAPNAEVADLIEGRLEALAPADIGVVEPIARDTDAAVIGSGSGPEPERGLFQLARRSPGGSYADGGGAGLPGTRAPLSGDCP